MNKHYSKISHNNLIAIEKAANFVNWLYSEIKPFINKNILEVGSGIGTYSEKFIKDFKSNKIILSDINRKYLNNLKQRFKNNGNINVIKLDLNNNEDFKKINKKLDTVIALNVLEHIKDDEFVLKNAYNLLNKKGKFIIVVPAHKFLFNCIDSTVGHYRRYTKKEIIQKALKTNFKIKKIFYFNFLSVFAWFFKGSIMKERNISSKIMTFYDKIIPFQKILEKYIIKKKAGLSLIIVLEK